MISFLFVVLLVKPLVITIAASREEFGPHISFLTPSLHTRLQPGAGAVPSTPSRFSEHSACGLDSTNCKFLSADYTAFVLWRHAIPRVPQDTKDPCQLKQFLVQSGTPIPTIPCVSETSLLRPKTSLCGIVTQSD